jgi:hypothetical protein
VHSCIFFLFNKFCVYVGFYELFILINKFIKHDRVNYLCCDIKYLDLDLSLSFFFSFFFLLLMIFFLFFYTIVINLLSCVHKLFNLHLGPFYVKKMLTKFACSIFFYYLLIF